MNINPKTIEGSGNQGEISNKLMEVVDIIIRKGSPPEKMMGISILIMIACMTERARSRGAGIDTFTEKILDLGITNSLVDPGFYDPRQNPDANVPVDDMVRITGKMNVLTLIEKFNDPEFTSKNFVHDVLGGGSEQDMKKPEAEYIQEGLQDIKEYVEKNQLSTEEANALIRKFLSDAKKIYGNMEDMDVFNLSISKEKLQCSLSNILFTAYQDFVSKCDHSKPGQMTVNDATAIELIKLITFSHKTGTTDMVWNLIKNDLSKFEAVIEVLHDFAKEKKITVHDLFLDPRHLDDEQIERTLRRHLNSEDVEKSLNDELKDIGITKENNQQKEGEQ